MVNINESNSTEHCAFRKAVSLALGVASSLPLTSLMAMANAPMPGPVVHAPTTHPVSPGAVHHQAHWSGQGAAATHMPMAGALNLASPTMSFLAGNLANFTNLTIDVGNRQQQVDLNTRLTAAEMIAAEQVILGGAQTIKLGNNGVATGGTVHLNDTLLNALNHSVGGAVSSLTVARGLQVVDSLSNLSLAGNFVNFGSFATASGAAGNTDTISAARIINNVGGNIASYSGGGGLVGADPNLNASVSFTNSGAISSAGNLTINAPVVSNTSNPGAPATMTAAQNVNINTQSLNNSGLIAALGGNVNVASNAALNVMGAGGTIQANNGNVNMSSTNGDVIVSGGNVLSQQVNFSACGGGNVSANLDKVTGQVNAAGANIGVMADTENLLVGTMAASDDPLLANTGTVTISSGFPLVGNNPVTIVAGQNIVSVAGTSLDTSGASGAALTLVAGATFTGDQTSGIVVTKGSATGGVIDLTGVNTITTKGTGGKGGDIVMVAFAGKNVGSGMITTPSGTTIDASGTMTNGNVTIIAGAKTGNVITTGPIVGNTVSATSATPVLVLDKGSKGIGYTGGGNTPAGGAPQPPNTGTYGASKTANTGTIVLGDVNASSLTINTLGTAKVDNAASNLNLGNVTVGKTGSFTVNASKNINLIGNITGGSTIINESGTGLLTGAGSVNTTSLTFTTTATAGVNSFNTNVGSLTFVSAGADITDNQGVNKMNLGGKISGAGGALSVTSNGQINVTSLIGVQNAPVTLTTSPTSKGGINIGAPIQVGPTGSITLNLQGKGVLTETVGNTITGNKVTIISNTSFGSKTKPIFTNANTLDLQETNAKNSVFVTDSFTGTLVLQDNNINPGGTLTFNSAADLLKVDSANYANISITDNVAGSKGIDFSGGANVGTGAGLFSATAAGAITDSSGAVLKGTTVTLTGTKGVGTAANVIKTSSANLALNSSTNSVFVTDDTAATVNGSSSFNPSPITGSFSVTDTGAGNSKTGVSLTVGKAVAGGEITLTTSGATPGNILVSGTLGTTSSDSVTIDSGLGVTTKGAINGNVVAITANGPTASGAAALIVGGAITGTGGSNAISLTTKGANTNSISVGGVLSANAVTVDSVGNVTTTKAINGVGPASTVSITGIAPSATVNAVTIGGVVTGITINIQNAKSVGNLAINANVGGPTTDSTTIDSTPGGGTITGKGVIGGFNATINANLGIGAAKAPVQTSATNLNINTVAANTGGTFINQKGNFAIDKVQTDSLTLTASGTTTVAGPVTVGTGMSLTSKGLVTVDGTITGNGTGTDSLIINAGAGFATNNGSLITAANEPVKITVTGAGTVNGSITAKNLLTLTTSSTFTLGATGKIGDALGGTNTITAKGAANINGALGDGGGKDVLAVSSGGALTVGGVPSPLAVVTGATGSTVGGVTFTNYGTIAGDLTLNASGSGNSFNNSGTIGGAADTISINALKGAIIQGVGGVTSAGKVSFNTAGTANITTDGLAIELVSGTAGTVNFVYANASSTNGNALKIDNVAATKGDLNITSNAGILTFNGGKLSTITGNINVQDTSTAGAATITFASNTDLHASASKTNLAQGNVSVFFGPANYTPAPGVTPVPAPTVQGDPTLIHYGATNNINGTINVNGASDVLNAAGRNINFNTASNPSSAISLQANVTITADPPETPTISAVATAANAGLVTQIQPTLATMAVSMQAPAMSVSTLSPVAVIANPLSTINSVSGLIAGPTVLGAGISDALNGVSNAATTGNLHFEHAIGGRHSNSAALKGGVSNSARRTLQRGPLLLLPEQNTVVETPYGSINVAANSVVLIVAADSGLAVYNLHDSHANAVVVNHADGAVSINPGRSMVLAKGTDASFAEFNPAPFVGYRRLESRAAGSAAKIYHCEFDLISLMRGLPQLGHLMQSDNARTRRSVDNILKTAIILNQLGFGGEAFKLYIPAKLMAALPAQR